jgi:myxalamid-type polyketide synthase MxaB
MNLTQGEGVEIVLNSLKGDFVEKSFSVLGKGGRFLEIGKLDIWSEEKAHQERPDAAYFPFDLLEVAINDPTFVATMFKDLMEDFQEGKLKPLPHKVFSIEDSVKAFRYMAQAKHIGKVVISLPDVEAQPGTSLQGATIVPDGSYLITGGLGALGLEVSKWLVTQGAKYLVLTGRSAPSVTAQEVIRDLEQQGTQVLVVNCDVSVREDTVKLLEEIKQSMPPLKGIIHAAGVLDDGTLITTSWERFEKVMSPKVAGSWNLHTLTQDIPLDFMIFFSSATSLLGASGQGNYAAGNAFMDALSHYRHAVGLPGLSINWGPWESGMAASLDDINQRRLLNLGMGMIPLTEGLQIFGMLLKETTPQIGVLPMDWSVLLGQLPQGIEVPFLEEVQSPSQTTSVKRAEFLETLKAAPVNERHTMLMDFIRTQIAKVVGLGSPEDIEPQARLFDLGLDSLMAIELNNRFEANLGYSLSQTVIFNYPTVESLVDYLASDVLALIPRETAIVEEVPAVPETLGDEQLDALLAEIESVSDREIKQRLANS